MSEMMHRLGLTMSGDWIEAWCGCGWKYHPSEADGARLERLREAHKQGHDHVSEVMR